MRLSQYSLIFIFCFTALLGGCCHDKDSFKKNEPVDFRLDTLSHDRFYLNQYRGKVVVLAFWATWCIPCKSELVELKSFASMPEFKNVFAAAVCTDPENIDDAKTIIKTLALDYPVLLDKQAKVFKQLGMSAVPTIIVIDQASKISLTRQGYDAGTIPQIKKHIESLFVSDKNIQ
ncbi:MAG: TlpA disulfide reductase family protein [Sedimentisphaerales bacterium]